MASDRGDDVQTGDGENVGEEPKPKEVEVAEPQKATDADVDMKGEAQPEIAGTQPAEPTDENMAETKADESQHAEGNPTQVEDEETKEVKGNDIETKPNEKQDCDSPAQTPKVPEKPKEMEQDAPDDSCPGLTSQIHWSDSTLNVMPTSDGKLLMTLCEGGFQFLLAAARANVGIKSGRYLFEVKIMELRMPVEHSSGKGSQQIPPQLLRLGFTDGKSSLFISEEDGSFGFDSEGSFITSAAKGYVTRRFSAFEVLGVLLNLDSESPNFNTISLFRDGVRACEPKAIPDALKGKILFPTVNYRNMTLHVNFGRDLLAPLPFKCKMLQQATEAHVSIDEVKTTKQCEVLLPVGLPDEGTFDWLDGFLREHPDYIEISDRAILDWARKSGLQRPHGFSQRTCNDRPGMEFGIREMDDLSVRRLIRSIAPVLNRQYVIMEVRNNLLVAQRKKVLEHFHPDFKKIAIVTMGEPSEDYKLAVQRSLLEQKKEKAKVDAKSQFERDNAEKTDTKMEKSDENADGLDKKEGLSPEQALADALDKAESVVLSEDEKAIWFKKPITGDLTTKDLANSFVNFSLPTQSEGFDEIRYSWQQQENCQTYLKGWIAEHKLTQKVDDLQPGTWFQEQMREWQSSSSLWHKIQGDFLENQRAKDHKPKEEQKAVDERSAKVETETKDSEACDDQDSSKIAQNDDAEDKSDVSASTLDPFLVEDICNASNQEPLFAHFAFEDWEMLKLRFEIHTLVHAFRRDLNDAERPSFHESHLPFYYNKYYKNSFAVKKYGVNSILELVELISDTIEIVSKNSILEPQLSDDTPLDNFVRLTEDERRRRQRRLDSGCESAALKVQKNSPGASSGRGYTQTRHHQRGGYQPPSRGGSGTGGQQQSSRSAIGASGGYSGRASPGTNSRAPASRGPPPASYNSNTGSRSGGYGGGSGGNSYGNSYGTSSRGGNTYSGTSYGGSGGNRNYSSGAPASRGYGTTTPAPPARSYGSSAHSGGSSYSSGGQKRPYPAANNPPASKYPRGSGSYGGSAASGSRSYSGGSSGGHGSSSYRR